MKNTVQTKKARLVKDITGYAIETIPAGTEITVYNPREHYEPNDVVVISGIGLCTIWADEFEFIEEKL